METNPYQNKFSPGSSHSILVDWLLQFTSGTTILDVGTASGMLGRRCQGRGLVFEGIEPVETWANLARPYYQDIYIGSLEQAPDAFLEGHQVVVCADVLEHMQDPEAQLARLVSLQNPGSVFLISIPNVANLWIRLLLLMGRFDYTERGILDQTHLRFFTRRTLVRMLETAGLQIERIIPSAIPIDFVHPFFFKTRLGRAVHWLLAAMTRAFPTLLGYQFIVRAVKHP